MNRLIFFVSFIVASILSDLAWADDIMTYVRTDIDVIKSAEAIVQGKVISIANFPTKKKGCFTNVYKLQVNRDFKGSSDGKIIQVGSINNKVNLSIGDELIVVLNKPIKNGFNFYNYCRYPSLGKSYKKRDIMITTGSIASSYRIDSDLFNIEGCGTSKRILFQDDLLKNGSIKQNTGDQCNQIDGNYDVLIRIIEKAVSQS